MARGLADLFDVESADHLLDAGRAGVGRRGLTEEVGLEGHHARIDEEERGIVEQQGRRRHDLMATIGEEPQEAATDLCGLHD